MKHQSHRLALLTSLGVGLLTCGLVLQNGGQHNETQATFVISDIQSFGWTWSHESALRIIHQQAVAYAEAIATPTPEPLVYYTNRDTPENVPQQEELDDTQTQQFVGATALPPVPNDGWAWLVCAAPFTWPCEWALGVISCESGGDPNAYNPAGPFIGLFQVLNGTTDPYQNAVDAHIQYVEWQTGIRPYRPWPNCP